MGKGDGSDTTQAYRIGAVARMTGVAADTLRVWERRYEVVEPQRSPTGSRLYSRDDIARLALIKRLVDAGHAIGSIARLDLGQLEERLQATAGSLRVPKKEEGEPCRVAILGDALPARVRSAADELEGVEIVGTFRDPVVFRSEVAALKPDLIVLEYPTVHEDTVGEAREQVRRSGAAQALVVFGFGRRDAVRRLDSPLTTPIRAPLEMTELNRWCAGLRGPQATRVAPAGFEHGLLTEPVPGRRFDAETLSGIAAASTTVKCECPHHLSDLIFSLSAFELYSAECENRSPEDAALHAYLHSTTARARAMLEDALARVLDAERAAAQG